MKKIKIIKKQRRGLHEWSLDLRVNGKRFRKITRSTAERRKFFVNIREFFAGDNCTCRHCGETFRFSEKEPIAYGIMVGKSPVLCADCLSIMRAGLPVCDTEMTEGEAIEFAISYIGTDTPGYQELVAWQAQETNS